MVFISTGTPWVDHLFVGTPSLVVGIGLLVFPDPSVNPVCSPAFVLIGIALTADGLWAGWVAGWKIAKTR